MEHSQVKPLDLLDSLCRELDLIRIIKRMKTFGIIDEVKCSKLHSKYSTTASAELVWPKILQDLESVRVGEFIQVLIDCGYKEVAMLLSNSMGSQVVTIADVTKRHLLNEEKLIEFCATNKKLIDDDAFRGGSRMHLEKEIESLCIELNNPGKSFSKRQFFEDKIVICFYLMTHTCSKADDRLNILERMRDITTRTTHTDKTLFNLIYHMCMAVNKIAKGDTMAVIEHEENAEAVFSTCFSPFLSLLKGTAHMYVADIQQRPSEDCYNECVQLLSMFNPEQNEVYGNIINLEHAHTLLGIGGNFDVRDIGEVPVRDIVRARDIIAALPEPKHQRRKLWFYMCKGRLHELSDVKQARNFIEMALILAKEYPNDEENIEKYLQVLSSQAK